MLSQTAPRAIQGRRWQIAAAAHTSLCPHVPLPTLMCVSCSMGPELQTCTLYRCHTVCCRAVATATTNRNADGWQTSPTPKKGVGTWCVRARVCVGGWVFMYMSREWYACGPYLGLVRPERSHACACHEGCHEGSAARYHGSRTTWLVGWFLCWIAVRVSKRCVSHKSLLLSAAAVSKRAGNVIKI